MQIIYQQYKRNNKTFFFYIIELNLQNLFLLHTLYETYLCCLI